MGLSGQKASVSCAWISLLAESPQGLALACTMASSGWPNSVTEDAAVHPGIVSPLWWKSLLVFWEGNTLLSLTLWVNCELPDVQAGFRKGRGTRDQNANIHWIIEKARKYQKNIYFCFIDYAKTFDCVDHNKLWKILQEVGILDHLTRLLRNLWQGKKKQLEWDMEQQTGSI